MTGALTVRAHAKINLWLHIGPRRADGFHELCTIYQAVAWHDRLVLEPRPGPVTLTCTDPSVPVDGRNLVRRALEALWRRLGRSGEPSGVAVHLIKRLPVGAGLGGGSADAAAALLGLVRLWQVEVSPDVVLEVAAAVGSDVPFFLVGGTALGVGRGERVRPLPDAPRRAVVIVKPPVAVATAEAYGWLDADRAGSPGSPRTAGEVEALEVWPGEIVNDLEAPVARRRPEVARIREVLAGAGAAAVGLCGSGSAVVGLFEERAAAHAAAERLDGRGWQVVVTRTLTRAEYERRVRPRGCGRAGARIN